ncbi:ATP-grasp fold amidoligase family protein (plasmid) [Entomospira nematocerorum]|uniref:Uncharacterized protein n=1 Tax=Entomospira nematocerorum TaxID=2719987 RepID=A0A968GD46_9SPIO|nr:ATP-grasp fold amidoligase family protein [Entomospira nematocera]NIZ47594.1 hypothetical protein [Entomospira nematocera]WDI34598.1 ATP-grasp fold amidoligase family protein [Entomospira nematocera]
MKSILKSIFLALPKSVQRYIMVHWVNPRRSIQKYQDHYGYRPNLQHPELFSEKVLQRVHTTCQTSDHYTLLADKYRVREFITATIGAEYLIPLINDFDSVDGFIEDYATNPEQYRHSVVKINHGSGRNYFIHDEILSAEQIKALRQKLHGWFLREDSSGHESHYLRMKPHIVVERNMSIYTPELVDYKFHMFKQADGSFQYVLHFLQNRSVKLTRTFFINNLTDSYTPPEQYVLDYYPFTAHQFDPDVLPHVEKMITLSQHLMNDLNYARIDWYLVDGAIYFGEITLTPAGGVYLTYLGESLNRRMGQMWVNNPH